MHFLYYCSVISFYSCQFHAENNHSTNINKWYFDIDQQFEKIGFVNATNKYDSLFHRLSSVSTTAQMLYYTHMRLLNQRDSAHAITASFYTDSIIRLFPSDHLKKKYTKEYAKALLLKGDDVLARRDYSNAYRSYYDGKLALTNLNEVCEYSRYSSRITNALTRKEIIIKPLTSGSKSIRNFYPAKIQLILN